MRALLPLGVLLSACRFGGPGGDALALVEPRRDGGSDAAGLEPAPPVGDGDGEPAPDAPLDASEPPLVTEDASVSAADASDDASAAEQCNRPAPTGCDPVHNTGCTAGVTQCVLDPESSAPAGRCVFSGPAETGCTESALSTTCPAQHTCRAGACRKYCFCDADCEPGESCSEPIDGAQASFVRLCVAADN
jgi:hypothetical protein